MAVIKFDPARTNTATIQLDQNLSGRTVDWRRELGVQIALQLPRKPADAFAALTAAWEAYRHSLLTGGLL